MVPDGWDEVSRYGVGRRPGVHFHGLLTPNAMDGTTDVTQDPVTPGQSFTYRFVAHGPAVGMYHSHHDAVKQVPNGLAGAILVGHEPVPAGVEVTQRQVMILDDSGTIGYALNGKSFPATAPIVAKAGEWVEVQYMNEGTQIHPMHLHGMPQVVMAKDGYPLATPSTEDTVTVAPGERYTVLIHATEPGTWVWHCHILTHAENDSGMFGMVTRTRGVVSSRAWSCAGWLLASRHGRVAGSVDGDLWTCAGASGGRMMVAWTRPRSARDRSVPAPSSTTSARGPT